jgi:hypothetical protein
MASFIPHPGPQRHRCRHCGQHSILGVRATGEIYDVSVGQQFAGAPGIQARQNAALRRAPEREKGDVTYTARRLLTDPAINTITRLSRYVRRYIGKPR